MDADAAKANLHTYLQHERAAVLAKLDGLSEYDVRRPLTATGTNLLGRRAEPADTHRRGHVSPAGPRDTPYVDRDTPRESAGARQSRP